MVFVLRILKQMSSFLDAPRARESEEELLSVVDEHGTRGGCWRSKAYWQSVKLHQEIIDDTLLSIIQSIPLSPYSRYMYVYIVYNKCYLFKKNDIIEKFFNPLLVRLLVIYQVYGLLFKFNSSKKKKMTT